MSLRASSKGGAQLIQQDDSLCDTSSHIGALRVLTACALWNDSSPFIMTNIKALGFCISSLQMKEDTLRAKIPETFKPSQDLLICLFQDKTVSLETFKPRLIQDLSVFFKAKKSFLRLSNIYLSFLRQKNPSLF